MTGAQFSPAKCWTTCVSLKLGEAPLTGKPVTEYATNSAAARAFRELAREVVELG